MQSVAIFRASFSRESHRCLPNLLDEFERSHAILVADGVTEYSPEETNVLAERKVLVGL